MNVRSAIPALIALCAPLAAEAAAPALIPVTGYLTDDTGAPYDGTVDVDFKIYRAATGTQTVWNNANQPMSVDVVDGQFTAYLGSDAALDLALFKDNATLYLGMAVDGGAEMQPRFEIGAAPYAGYAQYCDDAATVGGYAWDQFRLVSDDILWSEIDPTTLPTGLVDGDDVGATYVAGTAIAIAPSGPNMQISADQTAIEGWAQGVAYDTVTELRSALDTVYMARMTCTANQVLMYDGTGTWSCTNTSALPLSESVIDGFVANNGYATSSDLSTLTGRVTTAEGSLTTLNSTVTTLNSTVTSLQTQVSGLSGNPGNMLLQLELDENAGATSFVDTSGLGNDVAGTLGAVIAGSTTAHSTRSVSFSGAQGLIAASGNEIADSAQINTEMWIRTGDPSQTYTLFDKQGAYRIRLTGSRIEWTVTTVGGTCTITHASAIAANTWTHVSGSYDGLFVTVSVDGFAQAQTCNTGRIASTLGGVLTVGGKITGSTWSEVFNGNIDEIRVRPTAASTGYGGYGSLAPSTCPSGMVAVGTGMAKYCIDNTARASAYYDTARRTCANAGYTMCTDDQWGAAVGTMSVSCGSAWEWTTTSDMAYSSGYLKVLRGGSGNCRTKTWAWNGQHNNSPDAQYTYRCCLGATMSND